MHLLDYILLVLATAAGLCAAVGGIMLTLPEPRFRAVKVAFWAATISFGSLGTLWGAFVADTPLGVRLTVAGVTAAVAAVALTYVLSLIGHHEAPERADVTIALAFAEEPAVKLTNQSDVVAKSIKWTVVLWNLDDPKAYSNPTNPVPDLHEPLQIPIVTFDFLRPHTSSLQNLFGSPLVSPHVKKGDRLFGSASAVCPDCARGHTIIAYIVFGQGGWYAELTEETSGNVIIPRRLTRGVVLDYFNKFTSEIPEANRIPITDPF
jgi:hypothetical protein